MKPLLGLDIGGANLKIAHTHGTARTVPFELWKHPQQLPAGLRELVYAGVRRTPVLAVTRQSFGGSALAAEWFATMLDVYLLRGDLPEAADDCRTADGRPATVACAHARLARMRCADHEEMSLSE